MIYVVQREHSVARNPVEYAGSSAHEALMVASKFDYCKISLWKNGKYFEVTQQPSKDTLTDGK